MCMCSHMPHLHTPPPKATAILTFNATDSFCLAWNCTSTELYSMYSFVSDFYHLILISHLCWTSIFTSVCVCLVTESCPTLCNPVDYSLPDSSLHWILRVRKLEWVACPPLGDLPNPGIEPRSPTLQVDSLLSHQGSPRILEWVIYPFSRGSSSPRNRTSTSCIIGRFFTSWATREVTKYW